MSGVTYYSPAVDEIMAAMDEWRAAHEAGDDEAKKRADDRVLRGFDRLAELLDAQ